MADHDRTRSAVSRETADDRSNAFAALVRRYASALDLMSPKALAELESHLVEGRAFGSRIATLSPAASTVLDLGSGVGLPGIPIAIENPTVAVVLVERRRRRAVFLTRCVAALDLHRVVVEGRDVAALEGVRPDVVTARAFGTIADQYRATYHLHGGTVRLLTVKGEALEDEVERLLASAAPASAEVAVEPSPLHGRLAVISMVGGGPCRP